MSRRLAEGIDTDPHRTDPGPVRAVVALGANLGDRAATLEAAIQDLRRLPLVDEVRASAPVESVAVTPEGPDAAAPAYLNAVALVTTRLAPSLLMEFLHRIETRHGRERHQRWGDRTLDLDLISYGAVISEDVLLTLPHPRAAERDFVLQPWLTIDPDAELPGQGRVDAVLDRLRSGS
ncbi:MULTISPECIES: 2-amino-4-hydroxy-6-hydroxymethyldihydropteridine diphosphokinase [unclassified Microbacterium]|uniref:2-amino-4-hydroxy-6- hydroxymethyldihydropteridine diphosphokinase n=1 Tax=unclassified Microbacterium TaxID=2609290 RepID=UPI00214B6403|nr:MULTISPECIES: 2-amino-4-hydroxy-6-hydroxymethyldihydropteridine diphosphokinase [unclassified Microbacterium]MCR2808140.1 2-amino-4-hydroxy-6-hydroxymethyldihydropteridine diphosphokinase [Microbacterium sp. zg.B185]WIM19394.1 2-amino-4-hydroxy-6-hydroxymethyldihydropteridine diphosphokinase [Microbacterium sp. zg-B185]